MASAQGALERTTRTADDGTFAFAAVPAEVVVSVGRPDAADEVALRTNVSIKEAERKEIELVLPAAREAMTVEVTDERGTPLDGAQVSVLSLATDSPLRRTLFTGRDGRAVFKDAVGLPVRLSITRRGRAPENRDVDPAPSELRVELGGGVHVAGAITTRRGRAPLEGAEVTLYAVEGPRRARTDRAGNYSFDDVSPGSARLVASHAGYAKAEQEVRIERLPHADRDLSLEPIDLEEGGSIEGEVVDSHGDPIAGARVGEGSIPAYLPAGKLPSGLVVTDRRGQFKIEDLHDGEVVLEAFSPDTGRGRVSVHVSSGRSTRGVRITIAAASDETASEPTATGGVAISFDETLPLSSGVAVAAVVEGSEAERAGVQPGDRILTVDGQPVSSTEDAKARLFGPIGDDLVLEVSRAGAARKLRVARERVHR
jgi:protocatechuate 3,4-dioxygenase beta subunit